MRTANGILPAQSWRIQSTHHLDRLHACSVDPERPLPPRPPLPPALPPLAPPLAPPSLPPPSAPVLATVLRGRPVLTHVVLPGRGQLRARSASAPRPRRVIARVDFAVPRPPVLAVSVLGARSTRDAHGPAARAVRQRVSAPPEWHAVTLYPSGVSS